MLFLLLRATKNLPLRDVLKEMMAKYVGLDRPYSWFDSQWCASSLTWGCAVAVLIDYRCQFGNTFAEHSMFLPSHSDSHFPE